MQRSTAARPTSDLSTGIRRFGDTSRAGCRPRGMLHCARHEQGGGRAPSSSCSWSMVPHACAAKGVVLRPSRSTRSLRGEIGGIVSILVRSCLRRGPQREARETGRGWIGRGLLDPWHGTGAHRCAASLCQPRRERSRKEPFFQTSTTNVRLYNAQDRNAFVGVAWSVREATMPTLSGHRKRLPPRNPRNDCSMLVQANNY